MNKVGNITINLEYRYKSILCITNLYTLISLILDPISFKYPRTVIPYHYNKK